MDVLVRPKAKTPIFVGASGVGKTTLGRILAHKILTQSYPQTDLFKNELAGAEIIVTTPARISQMALSNEPTAQAAAVELFFEAVRSVEQNYFEVMKERKPLIVFIDGLHTMDPPQLLALRQILDNESQPVRVMGTSHNEALDLKLKQTPEVQKLFERIAVREFSKEKTLEILKVSWLPKFQARYNVTFDDNALQASLKVASYLRPGLSRPEAPILALQSLAVKIHRENNGAAATVTDDDVYAYARSVTGIPSNPHNAAEFNDYLEGLKKSLNERVLNQPRMADVLVKQWSQVLTGAPNLPKTVLFLGPTGVGKTLMAQTFAEKAFGDSGRMIEIDGTQMGDGRFALGSIFGVPNGVQSADLTSGILMEWLDDPARGKMGGVIVINEADKMHPDAWKRLMEFMSQGVITGGDGKARFANRHMIILTSNKGTREVLPDTVKEWAQAEVDRRVQQLSESDLKNHFLRADPARDEIVLPREVLARINAAVFANPVTVETAPGIGQAEVNKYVAQMAELYHVNLKVSESLVKHLAITGLDPLEGARPIHNQVETYLNQALTEARKKWNLPREANVEVDLFDAGVSAPLQIRMKFNGEILDVAAPKKIHVNPLEDKDVRDMLSRLPVVMHDHMVEQPEAVDVIVTAVKAKVGDAGRKRPISITLVGTTGVGKTEMGRALAKGMYGSGERLRVIALGEIHNTRELENVFGAVASSGVKNPAQFEQALMDNPQGGVIMFDEFSNMGGEDLVMKEALIKKFYTILEEGFWVSPRDGRIYDLKKYVFMFTGNDLEKPLQGVTSDDQRMAIWRSLKSREKTQAELRKGGVPEAFLGRQDAVVLLQPLVGDAKARVSDKLLEELKVRFEKQHQGVTLTWEPEFLQQLSRAFFTHDRGARSVRAVIENQITALVTDSLVQFGYEASNIQGVVLNLTLDDNLPERVYADGEVVARKVSLFAEIRKGEQRLQKLEMNVSDAAAKVVVLSKKEAEMRAYHEAGHVVANQADLTQQVLDFVTIRASLVNGQTILGYARYEVQAGSTNNITRKRLIALLAHYWGGRLAQEKAGYDPDSGWEADLFEMRRLTTDYLKRFGLHDGLVGVPVNEKGEPQLSGEQRADFEKEMKALFEESKKLAKERLDADWSRVQTLTKVLMEKGELRGQDVESLTSGGSTTVNCVELLR
jgi:ATP-dependent Clp protease ATP-binding subunit ClpA